VWTLANPAYAEYAVAPEALAGLKPASVPFEGAGTIPEVGLTSFMSLKRTAYPPPSEIPSGSPWSSEKFANLTVLITAGGGGTGSIGIELAKAWGAKHILTAATGASIPFVKSLGATYVTDYHKEDIFESLGDDTVDIVYDNYGAEGTADKAMRTIRPGGSYVLLPHSTCYVTRSQKPPCLAKSPKEGVTQLNYATGPDFSAHGLQGLDELGTLVAAGSYKPHVDRSFTLEHAAQAFNYSAGAGAGGVSAHIGKISITTATM
jgi:NADPH:quinone reductase-like Zn-dependent oxidoreductase